jgi:hypothetical protein
VDNCPVDPLAYMDVLKRTRRRRKYFFGTVLVYIPALWVTHKVFPTNRAMGIVFGIWLAILIISTFLVALSKCPRCGNYFHLHGMTLLILRKCLHCQLHIASDKIT